jgi:hypothetical protein
METFVVVFVDAVEVGFYELFGSKFPRIEEEDKIGHCRCQEVNL